jgi:hypothetical protein
VIRDWTGVRGRHSTPGESLGWSFFLFCFAALVSWIYGDVFVTNLDRRVPPHASAITAGLVFAVFLATSLTTWIGLRQAAGSPRLWRYVILGCGVLSIRLFALILFGNFEKAGPGAVAVYQAVALIPIGAFTAVVFPIKVARAFGVAFAAVLIEWMYSAMGIAVLHNVLELRLWSS